MNRTVANTVSAAKASSTSNWPTKSGGSLWVGASALADRGYRCVAHARRAIRPNWFWLTRCFPCLEVEALLVSRFG